MPGTSSVLDFVIYLPRTESATLTVQIKWKLPLCYSSCLLGNSDLGQRVVYDPRWAIQAPSLKFSEQKPRQGVILLRWWNWNDMSLGATGGHVSNPRRISWFKKMRPIFRDRTQS